MLCQKCHKNLATARYAEVVDGHVVDLQLCAECMQLLRQNTTTGFELSSATPSTRKPVVERVVQEALRAQRNCPSCGTLLTAVLEGGRVGCTHCYDTFGPELESMLEGLHRSLQHKGKTSHRDDARARLRDDLQNKRVLLRSVLRAENYEEAAALRDEIRSLENGLYISESGAD